MTALDEIYQKLKTFGDSVKMNKENTAEYRRLLGELHKNIVQHTKTVDKTDLLACIDAVSYHKNLYTHHLKTENIRFLTELGFSYGEIGRLFKTTDGNIRNRFENFKRHQHTGFTDSEGGVTPEMIEKVMAMPEKDFREHLYRESRVALIKSLYGKDKADIAKAIMLDQRQQKLVETEKLYEVFKYWLLYWTGTMVVELTRLFKKHGINEDAKLFVARRLDDAIHDTTRLFLKKFEREDSETKIDKEVKQAKRRGKWKKSPSKVSGSSVQSEDSDLPKASVTNEDVSTQEM